MLIAALDAVSGRHVLCHRASGYATDTSLVRLLAGTAGRAVGSAAIDRATGEIIGSSRFYRHDPARSEVEIGWTFLARRYWGGRYNGEMKRLMLQHAFQFVDHVVFLIGPQNYRSQAAIRKIGGEYVGMRPDGRGGESCVFQISAPRQQTEASVGGSRP